MLTLGRLEQACHIKKCPKECNMRGVCNIAGVCECKEPWTGPDCGVKVPEVAVSLLARVARSSLSATERRQLPEELLRSWYLPWGAVLL